MECLCSLQTVTGIDLSKFSIDDGHIFTGVFSAVCSLMMHQKQYTVSKKLKTKKLFVSSCASFYDETSGYCKRFSLRCSFVFVVKTFLINFNHFVNFVFPSFFSPTQISQNFYRAEKSFKSRISCKKVRTIPVWVEYSVSSSKQTKRFFNVARNQEKTSLIMVRTTCVQKKRAGVSILVDLKNSSDGISSRQL